MLHWDKEMNRLKVKRKLKTLSAEALLAYCAGVFEHSAHVVGEDPSWQGHQPAMQIVLESIEAAWHLASGNDAEDSTTRPLTARLANSSPDEDDPSATGQSDLVGGLDEVLLGAARMTAARAYDCASYAYQAVAEFALGVVSGGEDEFRKAEQSSDVCLNEIAYQLAFVDALAHITNGDFSRGAVHPRVGAS